jgi:hypothetical protein
MKFTTATLFLIIAFAAIVFGSTCWYSAFLYQCSVFSGRNSLNEQPLVSMLKHLAIGLPLWLPLVFVGFAVGRRRLTIPFVIVFAVAQIVAGGITYLVITAIRTG